jgi:hypothetical protein
MAINATAHNTIQAAIKWPSPQVSITWLATTTNAATTAASISEAAPRAPSKPAAKFFSAAMAFSARTTPGCCVG